MATLREIAAIAKVSIGTLSRYFNGYEVRYKTRIDIETALRQLGVAYEGGTTGRYYCLVSDRFSCAFMSSLISALQYELQKNNDNLVFLNSIDTSKDTLKRIKNMNVCGIILHPTALNQDIGSLISAYRAIGIPIIVIDHCQRDADYDIVTIDNEQAGYMATKLLIDAGHTNIAIAYTRKFPNYKQRYLGYVKAMREANICLISEYEIDADEFRPDILVSKIKELLSLTNKPTAIVSTSYYYNLALLKELYQNGIKIPTDISISAIDKLFYFAEVVNLDAIEQPLVPYAQEIVKKLNGIKDGKKGIGEYVTYIPLKYVKGDSIKRINK